MTFPRIDPDSARLSLVPTTRRECILGAHQRAASAVRAQPLADAGYLLTRRASGGPTIVVNPGSLHLALSLPRADTLTDCPRDKLQNRYVRPLLRALRRLGLRANYFGRDWLSAGKLPVAWIGSALYDDGRAWVEAILPLTHPFALPARFDAYPARTLAPFLGSTPTAIDTALEREVTQDELIGLIVFEYEKAYGPIARGDWTERELRADANDVRPAWDVLLEEAIGFIGAASHGEPKVGGDFFASEAAVRRLSHIVATALEQAGEPDEAAIGDAVHAVFRDEVIDGIRDSGSVTRLIVEVLRKDQGPAT